VIRIQWTLCLLALVALSTYGWLRLQPTRLAHIKYESESFMLPLSLWCILLEESERHTTYLGIGEPRFESLAPPWFYIEQMGSAHLLSYDQHFRLTLVTQKRSRWLTQIDLTIEPMFK
jgi:hypothetical protein